MPALSWFVGKGGVGKTTVAAAYAVRAAVARPRRAVLLLSTDPAHSLADVFDARLGERGTMALPRRAQLDVWQVNAERQFGKFLERSRRDIVGLLESGTIFSREEIEPLLDTTIPGMAEVAALLAIHRTLASGKYDEIVVDTAPMGHTLRLLQMPAYFARFLDLLELAASRDQMLAAHFGGQVQRSYPFLGEWRERVAQVRAALEAPESRLVMVTTPESFALAESARTARALAEGPDPLRIGGIVLNRAVVRAGNCAVCRQRAQATKGAARFLRQHFSGVPVRVGTDAGAPVVGAEALRAFGEHVFGGRTMIPRLPKPGRPGARKIKLERTAWPRLTSPLTWTIGKGGVGKTTISAALAVNERRRAKSRRVVVCSTDPAPSLEDVFREPVGDVPAAVMRDPKLRAVAIDAAAWFRAWADEVKAKIDEAFSSDRSGLHIELGFERKILLAVLDMVPPGLDEIAAVLRIVELVDERQAVLIDMAPTGHALELLRMPQRILLWSRLLLKTLAPHRRMALARDVAVQIATLSHRVRALAAMLQDGKSSRVVPVMLAEPLPDRETIRLLASLEDLGVTTTGLFVNRVLFPEDVGRCRRCGQARRWQMITLGALRRRWPERKIYVARNRAREVAGRAALESFVGELWQIV